MNAIAFIALVHIAVLLPIWYVQYRTEEARKAEAARLDKARAGYWTMN